MKQKGITLVELLISSSITAVVGVLLLTITINSSNIFYKQSSKVNLGLNSNDALTQIRDSVRQSKSVDVTSGPEQLVLQIPAINSSGDIISGVFDNFVFYKDTSKLRFKTFPNLASSRKAQDQIFSTGQVSLFFQYLDAENPPAEVIPARASRVRVRLTLQQRNGFYSEESISTAEAKLRNE